MPFWPLFTMSLRGRCHSGHTTDANESIPRIAFATIYYESTPRIAFSQINAGRSGQVYAADAIMHVKNAYQTANGNAILPNHAGKNYFC